MPKSCYLHIYDDIPSTKTVLERAGIAVRRMGSNTCVPAREGRRAYGVACSWQERDGRVEAVIQELEHSGRVRRLKG